MTFWVWTANLLGWPLIHVSIARVFLLIPLRHFAFKNSSRDREEAFYRKVFAVRLWKARLPDGAPWLGGSSKKRLSGRDSAYIANFILETRRAELAHWCMLACLPVFFLWNPVWARWVMTAYAGAANVPCIVAQRYNRLVMIRILAKLEGKKGKEPHAKLIHRF
jgi:glycosyl-4,4'-diaponeurosporenoate acyltransferase